MEVTPNPEKEKAPIQLSPDEMEALDEGLRSAREERRYTLDEVFEIARKRRQEWTKARAASA